MGRDYEAIAKDLKTVTQELNENRAKQRATEETIVALQRRYHEIDKQHRALVHELIVAAGGGLQSPIG